jgi:hypothetical protein
MHLRLTKASGSVRTRTDPCKHAVSMKFAALGACLVVLLGTFATSSAAGSSVDCQFGSRLTILPEIWEASGAALASGSPPRLWVINDSEEPIVYGVEPDGRIADRVRVPGVTVQDWEDLALGPCPAGRCLFIADIGDNAVQRPRITVYRIPEPPRGSSLSATAEAFYATYPDGPHNAESLFVDADQRMYVITKGRAADVYRFPNSVTPNSTSTLSRVGRLTLTAVDSKGNRRDASHSELATGAALSMDRNWVAIRSNQSVWFFNAKDFVAGTAGAPIWASVAGAREPQGEAMAFGPNGLIYLVGEGGSKGRPGTLRTMTCALPQ